MITIIWNFLLKKGFKYLTFIAFVVSLFLGSRWLLFKTWDKIAFSNYKVEKIILQCDTLKTNLKLSQSVNDSLNDVNYECFISFNRIVEISQRNADSLMKANKLLRMQNKELDSQINHFLEIAPCTELVEVKDKNFLKKNKKVRVFVNCPEDKE